MAGCAAIPLAAVCKLAVPTHGDAADVRELDVLSPIEEYELVQTVTFDREEIAKAFQIPVHMISERSPRLMHR